MLTWLLQSYWRDEAFSVLLAQKSFLDIIRISAHDFSPPLYFLLLRVWILMFGTSEVATRSLSLIFYLLTLLTICFFLKRFTSMNTWVIIFSVGFFGCIHSLMIGNAFETRMYTMVAWLATGSWYLALTKRWKMYAFITVAGIYTQYFMVLIVAVQAVYFILHNVPKADSLVDKIRNNRSSLVLFSIPLILFIPWVLYFLSSHNFVSSHSFWIPKPTLMNLITIPSFITFGYDKFSNFQFDVRPFSFLIYALLLLFFLQTRKSRAHIVYPLLLWVFMPGVTIWILSQFTTPLYLPRYLIVSSPALVILIIVCLHKLQPISKIIIAVFIFLMLGSFLTVSSHYAQTHELFIETKENLRSKITSIRNNAKPTDYLIVESELDYHVAQIYWFNPEHVKIIGKTYAQIPDFVGKSLIPESAILTKPYPKLEGYVFKKNRGVNKFP